MKAEEFVRFIDECLKPAMEPLGFATETFISGRLYLAEFASDTRVVSVSYEPGDENVTVFIFSVVDGVRSDPDDINATPRLSDLNRIFSKELEKARVRPRTHSRKPGGAEDRLRKAADELRVVLPLLIARDRDEQRRAGSQ
jgi:hypothetical protein